MILNRLEITQLRNLQTASLRPNPAFNLIFGENGSGKTSVLEAIHLLGTGRSFRVNQTKRVVQDGATECVVFGDIGEPAESHLPHSTTKKMGIRRRLDGPCDIRLDGKTVPSASVLAKTLPIQVIDANTVELLDGGPSFRRRYLDWLVFHVEHEFYDVWRRYHKALQQRNALLKQSSLDMTLLQSFETELVTLGQRIDDMRQSCFDAAIKRLTPLISEYLKGLAVHLSYYRGWDSSKKLEEVIEENRAVDIKYGNSRSGPHRADIKIMIERKPASDVLSRGQKKVLVTLLKLAQTLEYEAVSQQSSVMLVDDLPAELDDGFLASMIALLSELGTQVFITAIHRRQLEPFVDGRSHYSMFHVEHGRIDHLGALNDH